MMVHDTFVEICWYCSSCTDRRFELFDRQETVLVLARLTRGFLCLKTVNVRGEPVASGKVEASRHTET